jgi:hypothetical protein
VTLEKKQIKRSFSKGDMVILTNQPANRYLLETLEPNAPDSWFAWNFFEPILMQKEYFSAYVFEDLAAQFLKENPSVKAELDAKRKAEPEFAADASLQLDWVYRNPRIGCTRLHELRMRLSCLQNNPLTAPFRTRQRYTLFAGTRCRFGGFKDWLNR